MNSAFKQLFRVKKASIQLALSERNIIIKKGTRSCKMHLNEDGQLNIDQIKLIPTKLISIKYEAREPSHLKQHKNVFDQFRDMDTLNDKHCFAITRWSKIDFIRFSKFITLVKSSNGRTKEEIIAIYRYWLWRRIDQTSLSFIKTNCTQQDISNYLNSHNSNN